MDIKVIVDTNCTRNEKALNVLLGNREELTQISELAKIIIPDIVIDELIQQKRSVFENAKEALLGNVVLKHIKTGTLNTNDLEFDSFEKRLRTDQSIPYEIISISDAAVAFNKARELAVGHSAPFEKSNDKGFKDTCIALTIEEYLQQFSPEARVFFYSKDARLIEFFEDNEMIIPIKSFDDLKGKLNIKGHANEAVPSEEIKSASEAHSIEIKEPTVAERSKRALLTEFRNTRSFAETHRVIEILKHNRRAFDEDDYCDILRSACNNEQIYRILEDDDVAEFMLPVFEKYVRCLKQDQCETFVRYAGVSESRLKQLQGQHFSEEEKRAYRTFADELSASLISIGSFAQIRSDTEYVLTKLREILVSCQLEDEVPSCASVLTIFIDGKFACEKKGFSISVVEEFTALMDSLNRSMQEVLLSNIERRLATSKIDHTDALDIPF